MPVIENIRLVDRLASDAAEHERQRIARDIHDSVIQPYIGLQIGLSAIDQKLGSGKTDVSFDVKHLIKLTDLGIDDLRNYVRGLKQSGGNQGGLLPSIRRFASKFSAATAIEVSVESKSEILLNDRLSAEVFQMVAEALSNIRRHTRSRRADMTIECVDGGLVVKIKDEGSDGSAPADFSPVSITDRARALGGQVRVEHGQDGGSTVVIEIPL